MSYVSSLEQAGGGEHRYWIPAAVRIPLHPCLVYTSASSIPSTAHPLFAHAQDPDENPSCFLPSVRSFFPALREIPSLQIAPAVRPKALLSLTLL